MLTIGILFSSFSIINCIVYDVFSGEPATRAQIQQYNERNNSQYCAMDIQPCDRNEWRRVDGSCNNLKYPTRGAPRTPTLRLLTPEFSVDYEPRLANSGVALPLERIVRCEMLQEGRAHDLRITMLVSYYVLFMADDINSIHDIRNYIENITTCCTYEGRSKYECIPSEIPVHDQVHRYSGVHCQNLTRPQTFQYFGCREFGTTFARIVYATPVLDLSNIYTHEPGSINHIRAFTKGLLKYDSQIFEKTGKIFPLGNYTEEHNRKFCKLNQFPKEAYCMQYHPNAVLGPTIFLILFYRQHNYIAKTLYKLNPCWDDERIFYTARDINIAIQVQIFLYELLPLLLGERNMIKNKIILNSSGGLRDMYDEEIQPQVSDEYAYMHRWLHTIQEAKMKLYDDKGFFLKTFPMVNLTNRLGYLSSNENLDEIFSGSFRQPSAKFDFTIDFDMAERIFGGMLFASDVATSDVRKGRYFGFPSYVKYRELCAKKQYKTFNDLKDVICEERIQRLRDVYKNVEDIDVMAGVYAEKYMPGGKVPYTFYCIVMEQLKRTIRSDRHWFERPNRPHAFTKEQREAIGKVTVAGVLCTNADNIHKIQPRAFYSIDKYKNPLEDCTSPNIGNLGLSPWKDVTCNSS